MTNVNTPYTSLPPTVGSLTGSEIVAVVQGGTTKQTTTRNLGSGYYTANFPATIEFVMDGSGYGLNTGMKGYLVVPFECTATSATLLADKVCSASVDVWKCTQAEFDAGITAPTSADSITGSNTPTIASTTQYYSQNLTTWVSSFGQGDVLAYNIDSVSGAERLTLSILCTRSLVSS